MRFRPLAKHSLSPARHRAQPAPKNSRKLTAPDTWACKTHRHQRDLDGRKHLADQRIYGPHQGEPPPEPGRNGDVATERRWVSSEPRPPTALPVINRWSLNFPTRFFRRPSENRCSPVQVHPAPCLLRPSFDPFCRWPIRRPRWGPAAHGALHGASPPFEVTVTFAIACA